MIVNGRPADDAIVSLEELRQLLGDDAPESDADLRAVRSLLIAHAGCIVRVATQSKRRS